jgi:hypothetical protein
MTNDEGPRPMPPELEAELLANHYLPPIAVELDEIVLPLDSEFAEECRRYAQWHMDRVGGQLHEMLLTFHKPSGLVWRADYTLGRDLRPLVNRVICWRRMYDASIQIAMAVGQATVPLSEFLATKS